MTKVKQNDLQMLTRKVEIGQEDCMEARSRMRIKHSKATMLHSGIKGQSKDLQPEAIRKGGSLQLVTLNVKYPFWHIAHHVLMNVYITTKNL